MGCSSPCGRRCKGATPAAKRRYDRVPHDARRPVGRLIYVTSRIPWVFAMPVLPQLCWGWTNLGHNLLALWVAKTVRPGSSPEAEVVRYLRQEPRCSSTPHTKPLVAQRVDGTLSPRGLKPLVAQRKCCPISRSGVLPLCRENARRFFKSVCAGKTLADFQIGRVPSPLCLTRRHSVELAVCTRTLVLAGRGSFCTHVDTFLIL